MKKLQRGPARHTRCPPLLTLLQDAITGSIDVCREENKLHDVTICPARRQQQFVQTASSSVSQAKERARGRWIQLNSASFFFVFLFLHVFLFFFARIFGCLPASTCRMGGGGGEAARACAQQILPSTTLVNAI